MSELNFKERENSWKPVPGQIRNRLVNAIKSVRFIVWFCGGILLLGGGGIWLPLVVQPFQSDPSYIVDTGQNIFTYTVALLGVLFLEFFLVRDRGTDLGILGLGVGLISLCFCVWGFFAKDSLYHWNSSIGILLALVLYVAANANDERFDSDTTSPESTSTGYKTPDKSKLIDKE